MKKRAKEAQNQIHFDQYEKKGPVIFGPMTSYIWRDDPKHIGFIFGRYKFAAKLLAGKKEVLEIGCGDAIATPVVAQVVEKVYSTDFEPLVIEDNKKRLRDFPSIQFSLLDITKKPFEKKCDGVFTLDVIEHIEPTLEGKFFQHVCKSIKKDGVCIIGTPNIEAHRFASKGSREGHINLKSYKDFGKLIQTYFTNGFIFSMNDEVVHTGFYPMAHYLFMVGVGVKNT